MRVLHLITGLAAGGAETQLRQLLRHSDYEADVVALGNAGCIAEEIRSDGRPVGDLEMRSNRQVAMLGRLTRLIRGGGYDVVHTHLYRAAVYGRIAARLANVPVVISTEHSLCEDGRIEGRVVNEGVWALYRLAERCGDLTIAVSVAVHRALRRRGIAGHRVTTVPNGMELDRYAFSPAVRERVRAELRLEPRSRVIGTVSRLHPWKNVDMAIRAAAPLLGDDTVLLVVGDGAERSSLAALADRLGIARHITFLGERLDVPALLSAMDVFVFPSQAETFGLAGVEALASGLPLVYQLCPALEDWEAPGSGGPRQYRVGPGEAQLREAIRAAVRDVRPGADRRPPDQLRQFDMRHTAARVQQIYHEMARQKSRPGAVRQPAAALLPRHEMAPHIARRRNR